LNLKWENGGEMQLGNTLILLLLFSGLASPQTLHGVGSAFPTPLYSQWFRTYEKANPKVKLHFKPAGSAAGISELIDGKADFAATETPLTDDQRKAAQQKLGSEILQIPTTLGAVVPIYRVDGADAELKFTAGALAGIFLGKITKWNDPAIADANPGVSLPDNNIVVVHRSDPSDTTLLWTDFLSEVSPQWKAGPGTGLSVKWPVGIGVSGDDGIEELVVGPKNDIKIDDVIRGIPNSIGYVQLHFAIEQKLPYGDVESSQGAFVRAAESSIMAEAASAAAVPDAFRKPLVNAPSPTGYPISTFTWILVPSNPRDKGKSKAIADFLRWALQEGQATAERLHYIPLPPEIVEEALGEVSKLQ
jgi:phosphate transport system substrate-binding protein